EDVAETAVVAGITLAAIAVRRRDLLVYCFDPQHARSIGLPVGVLHYGLLILLSLTIVVSLKAVGIILVGALLVPPGATAQLTTNGFERMLLIASTVAIGSCIVGTLLSFHIDGSTGPCIVLIQAALFVLALLFGPQGGLLRGRRSFAAEDAGPRLPTT